MNRRKFLGVLVGGIAALAFGKDREFIGKADLGAEFAAFTLPVRIEELRSGGEVLLIGGEHRMFEMEADGRVYEILS